MHSMRILIDNKMTTIEAVPKSWYDDAIAILRDLYEDSACSFDHHGYCQEHGWLSDGVCPQKRIGEILGAA